jgi:hypothetical protein
MSNLQAVRLRTEVLKIKDIIKSFYGEHPSSETRELILELINNVCIYEVIDTTKPEDIDNEEFRYSIQANPNEEVMVKFTF